MLTCTLGDCVEETGLANSFSTALDFALNSIKSKLTGHNTNNGFFFLLTIVFIY